MVLHHIIVPTSKVKLPIRNNVPTSEFHIAPGEAFIFWGWRRGGGREKTVIAKSEVEVVRFNFGGGDPLWQIWSPW